MDVIHKYSWSIYLFLSPLLIGNPVETLLNPHDRLFLHVFLKSLLFLVLCCFLHLLSGLLIDAVGV